MKAKKLADCYAHLSISRTIRCNCFDESTTCAYILSDHDVLLRKKRPEAPDNGGSRTHARESAYQHIEALRPFAKLARFSTLLTAFFDFFSRFFQNPVLFRLWFRVTTYPEFFIEIFCFGGGYI